MSGIADASQGEKRYEPPAVVELGTLHELTMGHKPKHKRWHPFYGLSVVRISSSI
jgi:hypothetical protein